MLRLIALGLAFVLIGLIASVSSLVADEQPVPPADPKSQEECRTYRRQQIDYAHIALQKSKECSARNRASQNEDTVLYQPSCGGKVLSAFRSCKELSDAAWCALADESAKMRICVEKASAAEQKRATDVLAQSEMPIKIESEQLLQEQHAAAEISEALQKSRQQERARSLEQDKAAARRDTETQTPLAAKTLDDASRAKQADDLTAVRLRQSLKEEQERASRLEALVAAAQRDVETQTALAAKATDEASRVKQAAEQSSAALKLSLQKERERADGLSNDLSMARAAIYAYEAQASKASDHATDSQQSAEGGAAALRTSLQQEQERAVRLEQDLAAARREIDSWAAKANAEATQLRQADDNRAQSLRLLQQEREKSARLERELASERNTAKEALARSGDMTTTRGAQDRPPAADAITGAAAAAGQPAVPVARRNAEPEPENAAEVARLVARASGLLGQGDISSARVVLERAAETGDAQASFALAETYDPVVLRKWGAYGTLGDAAKARELYARAQAGGIKQAMETFDPLHRRFVRSDSGRIGDPQKGAGR